MFFNAGQLPWSSVSKLFEAAGRPDMAAAGPNFLNFYTVEFYADDPRLEGLRTILAREGIEWLERREHLYTHAELQAAPLLVLSVQTPERAHPGPRYGTRYDLSDACPACGTGAVQISPLLLNPAELPKKGHIFQIMDHEKLVSLQLAHALTQAGVSGLELRPARSCKGPVELPWAQLLAHVHLPPVAPTSRGITREDPCAVCARDGYFGDPRQPLEIEYSLSQLPVSEPDELPDAVYTYEYFGKSRLCEPLSDSYFARPLLLVRPTVYRVFRQLKVRDVKFIPVSIVQG